MDPFNRNFHSNKVPYRVALTSLSAWSISGDIEISPCPKRSSNIKFCHWNLNGLPAHDFIKVPLVETFITSNNFDLVCLFETFLNSTIPNDDVNIQINGYPLLRADHPNDIKRGGVCIYFKESLPT